MDFVSAFLLAVIEGATEFLPISSTGHLILAQEFLRFSDDPEDAFANAFIVVIQLPAILAVAVYFWEALWPFGKGKDSRAIIVLWTKIVAAFVPAAILGALFDDVIEKLLFHSKPVAIALIVGGIVLIVLERIRHKVRVDDVRQVGYPTAVAIGLFQCLAMIPGTSRSAATIIGAMLLGASRPVAAEFSFFLAVPTMTGATAYKLMKGGLSFTAEQWALIGVGSAVSFVVAYGVVALFMSYIRKRDFTVFGVYRIILGVLVLLFLF